MVTQLKVVNMPTKLTTADLDDLVKRYLAGEPIQGLASRFGLSHYTTVYYHLRRAGIRASRAQKSAAVQALNPEQLAADYRRGESVKSIAQRAGVSCDAIRSRLVSQGVTLRSTSEQGRIYSASLTPEQRRDRAAAANAAARGSTVPAHRLAQRAITLKERGWDGPHVSQGDRDLGALLAARGLQAVPQQAIGPYNVDLALSPVAVEVHGGSWHRSNAAAEREREDYILDAGWHLLIFWTTSDYPLQPRGADEVAAYVDLARSDPSLPREKRVIRGNGQLTAAYEAQPD
jgi:hypothetical protein